MSNTVIKGPAITAMAYTIGTTLHRTARNIALNAMNMQADCMQGAS